MIDKLLFSTAHFISKFLKFTTGQSDSLPVDRIIRVLKFFLLFLILTGIFMPCLLPVLVVPIIITIVLI
ncbi:MAG: hypothetical protein ABRQ38_08185, partial [Candidatus Eremiobacterota bacterium]